MIDNSNLPTSEILNCVSDQANSYTKDSLVLENDEATFTWSTSNPNLYHIEDGMGTISKVYQTHKEQTITVSVKIAYKMVMRKKNQNKSPLIQFYLKIYLPHQLQLIFCWCDVCL